jgi:predicted DNA-binding transcriptional regulator AlpA
MTTNIIEYLNTKQAAAYLGVSRQWLEIGRTKGYGPPFIKAGDGGGGIVRYMRSEIDGWMFSQQRSVLAGEDGS